MAMRTRLIGGKTALVFVLVALWLTLGASLPWADTILPDPLFIGDGVGGICPTGGTSAGTFPPSGLPGSGSCWVYDPSTAVPVGTPYVGPPAPFSEVNELTTAGKLDVFKNGDTTDRLGGLNNPLLLIFAIPNKKLLDPSCLPFACAETAALTAGSVTGASLYHPLTPSPAITPLSVAFGTTAYGLSGSGFQGTLGSGQEIYSFLGLPPPGVSGGLPNSNSFTNWTLADWNIPQQLLGFIPFDSITGYSIYVYAISSGTSAAIPMMGGDAIDVSFRSCPAPFTNCGSSLPIGSFVVAYGQGPKKPTQKDPNPFEALGTPFTQTGIQMPPPPHVPEPSSLLLFGSGLVFVGHLWRKRQGRNK